MKPSVPNDISSKMKDCNIKRHQILAIAMKPNGYIVTSSTNKKGIGRISDFSYHAEELLYYKLAGIRAVQRLGKIVVLVVRISEKHGVRLARPCKGCQNLLRGVANKVFYTTDHGTIDRLL